MNPSKTQVSFQSKYLSALLSSIDESVVATDENFIIQYWNKGAEQIFGYKAEHVVGRRGNTILKFIYLQETEESARHSLIKEGHWKGKVGYIKEGKNILIDASVTVVKNDSGEVTGYVGVHRDVTEYDQTKESLHNLLSLVSSLDDNFFIVDKKLNIVFIDDKINSSLKDLYGITYTVGENITTKLPQWRREQVRESFETALAGEKKNYQLNVISMAGKSVWLQMSYIPIKNESGFVTHACCLVRDITAEKEIEQVNQMLFKSRQLFETFMENSPILSWITDNNGTVQYLNPAYLKKYQFRKENIGKRFSEIFPEKIAKALEENDAIVRKTLQPLQTTEKAFTPDNKEHIYQVIKFPVQTNGDIYIGGWAIDVTEEVNLRQSLNDSVLRLRESEKTLKKALADEHHLNDLKSRFVAMASHEFRTPLSSILSSIFLLERYTTTEQQVNRTKHIHKIKEAIHHMNALLEDFLSFGKLEEGKTPVSPARFNSEELILETIEDVQSIRKSNQVIEFIHEGEKEITTDKKLLKNIIINLLSNAIKFSDDNEIIRITCNASEKQIEIIVKDKGIGISKDDQKHLFESFYRARNAQNIQGTGLGLHIVKRYAQLLNGTIKLESDLGKGTIVTVTLPQSG